MNANDFRPNEQTTAAPEVGAQALKARIGKILLSAVSGTEPKYRHKGYVRWGLVQDDINKAIDDQFRGG